MLLASGKISLKTLQPSLEGMTFEAQSLWTPMEDAMCRASEILYEASMLLMSSTC